jgi:hypothetical protein
VKHLLSRDGSFINGLAVVVAAGVAETKIIEIGFLIWATSAQLVMSAI